MSCSSRVAIICRRSFFVLIGSSYWGSRLGDQVLGGARWITPSSSSCVRFLQGFSHLSSIPHRWHMYPTGAAFFASFNASMILVFLSSRLSISQSPLAIDLKLSHCLRDAFLRDFHGHDPRHCSSFDRTVDDQRCVLTYLGVDESECFV